MYFNTPKTFGLMNIVPFFRLVSMNPKERKPL